MDFPLGKENIVSGRPLRPCWYPDAGRDVEWVLLASRLGPVGVVPGPTFEWHWRLVYPQDPRTGHDSEFKDWPRPQLRNIKQILKPSVPSALGQGQNQKGNALTWHSLFVKPRRVAKEWEKQVMQTIVTAVEGMTANTWCQDPACAANRLHGGSHD